MAYFGGGGVRGTLHPSLRAYIDCFMSSPMPKVYPRGGGPHDQDPLLMRHFRIIRAEEVRWKEQQERMEGARKQLDQHDTSQGGSGGGIDSVLDEFIRDQEGENDHF